MPRRTKNTYHNRLAFIEHLITTRAYTDPIAIRKMFPPRFMTWSQLYRDFKKLQVTRSKFGFLHIFKEDWPPWWEKRYIFEKLITDEHHHYTHITDIHKKYFDPEPLCQKKEKDGKKQ